MSSRDFRLDRAKGVLIFMVVLGHILTAASAWEPDTLRVIQVVIYSFHMPAFVFLAGITAKSNRLLSRTMFFLVLLATATPLYYGWMSLLGLDPDFDFLVPYWLTWFLMSMVWWMLSVPLIERFPRAVLTVSITAGLIGGAFPLADYELSISRTLVFWPFFVVGKVYGARILRWAGSRSPRQSLALAAAALTPTLLFYLYDVNKEWFYGSRHFDWFDVTVPEGLGMRAGVAVAAGLSTLALLATIPNKNGYLATVGRHSLAVYLLHGFVVRLLDIPMGEYLDQTPAPVIAVLCLALAAVTTWLFTLTPFNAAIRSYGEGLTQMLLSPLKRLQASRRTRSADQLRLEDRPEVQVQGHLGGSGQAEQTGRTGQVEAQVKEYA